MVDLTSSLGLALILVGIILAVLAMIFMSASRDHNVKGGGVVMIGPIPIIFGSDRQSVRSLILLATILMLVLFAFSMYSRLGR